MKAKKIKRLCSVRGCRNTETYAITKTSEYGGLIICKQCLDEAIKAIDESGVYAPIKKEKAVNPLFFNPGGQVISASAGSSGENESRQERQSVSENKCEVCGKICASKTGLSSHMRIHTNDNG